jgi:hypothetical protein
MRKDDMEAGKEQLLQTVEDRSKLVGLDCLWSIILWIIITIYWSWVT